MKINIDVDSSIERSKLVYRFRTGHEVFDHILFFLYSLILVSLASTLIIFARQMFKGVSFWYLLIFFGILLLGISALYTLLSFDKLIRFRGHNPDRDAYVLREIILKMYGSAPAPSNKMMSYYRRPGTWRNGKRIIVLFSGNDILVNVATFNYRNIRSPLHGIFDHIAIFRIKKEFQKLTIIDVKKAG